LIICHVYYPLFFIKIAEKELNIKTIERNIDRTELYISDEIFLCGSAMEVVSVLNVDGIFINNNIPGKITETIKETYFKIVRGVMEKYINWLTPIY
jgi:branched-chain amino acid aminotransferase